MLGLFAFVGMIIFITILVIAWYAWKEGALMALDSVKATDKTTEDIEALQKNNILVTTLENSGLGQILVIWPLNYGCNCPIEMLEPCGSF